MKQTNATKASTSNQVKKMTAIALFGALAYLCLYFIKIPIQFLTLDIKDSVIILCALLFGPLSGLCLAILVPLLEMITVSGTGIYGFLMNSLSSATFALVVGGIYRFKKSMMGATIGLVTGVFSVTAVMLLANLWITPLYMGGTMQMVAALIPKLLLPFNLVKAILNASIVLLLYKPLSTVLKRIGFLPSQGRQTENISLKGDNALPWRSLISGGIALLLIGVSLLLIFFVLGK